MARVSAVTDLIETVRDADILLFIVPHQFIHKICSDMKGHVKPSAMGVTLIKGVSSDDSGEIRLISEEISEMLGLPMSALMGANLAREVAHGNFCESTLGCTEPRWGAILRSLFHTPNFRVNLVRDSHTVELCGALKNLEDLEKELLNGQRLQGPHTAAQVYRMLEKRNMLKE
uniref:PAS domain-containing protein n=1 Tax=Romanomermis culicivorax TaxID=13658 RepID=A0A915JT50_ROMCU